MNCARLFNIAEQTRHRDPLTRGDKQFILETVPHEVVLFPQLARPRRIEHPGGFTLSGAPMGTFLKCAMLLTAKRVLGVKYSSKSEFYDRVERDLALQIMRSYLHHGYPLGTHCCAQCTLAVYPVLRAKAIRWINCGAMANEVRELIEDRQWRFSKFANARMIEWSLG